MLNTEERLFLLSIIKEKIEFFFTDFGFESNKNKIKNKAKSNVYRIFICTWNSISREWLFHAIYLMVQKGSVIVVCTVCVIIIVNTVRAWGRWLVALIGTKNFSLSVEQTRSKEYSLTSCGLNLITKQTSIPAKKKEKEKYK